MFAVGVVLFAGVGVGIGLLIWREPVPRDRTETAHSASLAPAIKSATGGLDTSTGRARIGQATMTLPGEPYELYPDPVHIDGVVDVIFLANADVHSDYDGHHDWQATVALAQISSELADGSDLEQAGTGVMKELGDRFFGGYQTQIKRLKSADRAVGGHAGMEFSADVHYSAKGLPSSYDQAVVWLVRCEDGSLIAAISSVPNDARPEIRAMASAALDTLGVS